MTDPSAARVRHRDDAAYPTGGELLEAIETLLHWGALAAHRNQGGLWFYDPEGMGTRPLNPTEIRALYEKEAEARGVR